MTSGEKDIFAVERTATTLSSDLQSVLSRTSRMFELFTSALLVVKDRTFPRKVGDSHLSESDVLLEGKFNSSVKSPLGGVHTVDAPIKRTRSTLARRDNYLSTAAGGNDRIEARNGTEVRSGVPLNGTAYTNGGVPFATDSQADGEKSFESCGKGILFSKPVANSGLERTVKDLAHDLAPYTGPEISKGWNVRVNPAIIGSTNPIRKITDSLVLNDANGKHLISLAQGDPAQFGPHMKVPDVVNTSLIDVVRDGRSNGYALSSGLLETRRAVAEYLSAGLDQHYTPQDVTLTSGCSQAIQHSIDILRFDGCNFLVPSPGFPLYETVCSYFGVECRHYDLLEDRSWEVNLLHVATVADGNTAAIIVCNPGNPSGTVYDYQHLSQIASLAEKLKVPIIADEVYASLVFGQNHFVPMATFSSKAPVLTVGGVSKNWLAPGWRLGWLAASDPHSILQQARVLEALTKIMQITLGPSTLMQAALPKLLHDTPATFFEKTCNSLRLGADFCLGRIDRIRGLDCPSRPQGSMFMMVRIDPSTFHGLRNDVEFSAALLQEESILVLPGSAFGRPNWVRIVFALSLAQLGEAWDRVEEFCNRHSR